MGFLGFGKKSPQKDSNSEWPVHACVHPIAQQKPLFEDAEDPKKVTSIKCFECGVKLPPAATKKGAAA